MITFFIIGFLILGPMECSGLDDPNDTKWWETALFYEVTWHRPKYHRFFDSFNATSNILDYVKKLGMDALCLQPIFPSKYYFNACTNYTDVNKDLGTVADIAELISKAHEKDIKVILDVAPFYTGNQHPWFQHWEDNINPYNAFYAMTDRIEDLSDLDWITWSRKRHIWYWQSYGKDSPILNMSTQAVRSSLNEDIFTFWLRKGVDGFRIIGLPVHFLATVYYDGKRSPTALQEAEKYLKEVRKHVDQWTTKNNSTSKYLAVETLATGTHWSDYYGTKDSPGVVPLNNLLLSINSTSTYDKNATSLKDLILSRLKAIPPNASISWMLSHWDYVRLPTRIRSRTAGALTILMMLLPGHAYVLAVDEEYMEDRAWPIELVSFDPYPPSYRYFFANIAKLRKLSVFKQSKINLEALNDDAVLVLRRYTSGDPYVYVAVINLADREEKINLTTLYPELEESLDVLINTATNDAPNGEVQYRDSVKVSSSAGIVLRSTRKRESEDDKSVEEELPEGGKEASANPIQHDESGTTEKNKSVDRPKKEDEGRTEKYNISGENDQGRGDEGDKSVEKGREKPSKSGEDAAAKGKEDGKVNEKVEDDPKGKEINKDEGRVGHEETTGWGVSKWIGKFRPSIRQLSPRYWRKTLKTASWPKT